jgi:hypothetical protein
VADRVLPLTMRVPPRCWGRRARGNRSASGGPSLFGMSAYRTVRSGASEWVRHRQSKTLRDVARLCPAPGVSDVYRHRDLLQRQCDRSSLRKFQSLRYCANPYCCCSYQTLSRPRHEQAFPGGSRLLRRRATGHRHAVVTLCVRTQSGIVAAVMPAVTAVCSDGLCS